jgi:hypothetical protein
MINLCLKRPLDKMHSGDIYSTRPDSQSLGSTCSEVKRYCNGCEGRGECGWNFCSSWV